MSSSIETLISREYPHGFVTDIESDTMPAGLSEDVVRAISAKKNEPAFMVEWRVQARNAAAPPDVTYVSAEVWDDIHSDDAPACACRITTCFAAVEYESRRCCEECRHG